MPLSLDRPCLNAFFEDRAQFRRTKRITDYSFIWLWKSYQRYSVDDCYCVSDMVKVWMRHFILKRSKSRIASRYGNRGISSCFVRELFQQLFVLRKRQSVFIVQVMEDLWNVDEVVRHQAQTRADVMTQMDDLQMSP